MDTLEVQHWLIIGLLVMLIAVIGFAAAWSISRVNVHLERMYSTLRDISGFMLILSTLERQRAEIHNAEGATTRIETPSATVTVSGGTEPMQQEISR